MPNRFRSQQLMTNKAEEVDLLIVDLNTPNKNPNLNANNKNKYNNNHNSTTSKNLNNSFGPYANTMKYSKSDNDGFKPLLDQNFGDHLFNNSVDNLRNTTPLTKNEPSSFLMDLDTDLFKTSNNFPTHLSYPSLYPRVEIINNNDDMYTSLKSPPSSPPKFQQSQSLHQQSAATTILPSYTNTNLSPQNDMFSFNNNNINLNNNNNISNNSYSYNTSLGSANNYASGTTPANATNFSHAFQASLAATPGVTIMPLNPQHQQLQQQHVQQQQQQQYNAATNLFSYGFYDTTTNDFNIDNNQCKLEVSTSISPKSKNLKPQVVDDAKYNFLF